MMWVRSVLMGVDRLIECCCGSEWIKHTNDEAGEGKVEHRSIVFEYDVRRNVQAGRQTLFNSMALVDLQDATLKLPVSSLLPLPFFA